MIITEVSQSYLKHGVVCRIHDLYVFLLFHLYCSPPVWAYHMILHVIMRCACVECVSVSISLMLFTSGWCVIACFVLAQSLVTCARLINVFVCACAVCLRICVCCCNIYGVYMYSICTCYMYEDPTSTKRTYYRIKCMGEGSTQSPGVIRRTGYYLHPYTFYVVIWSPC